MLKLPEAKTHYSERETGKDSDFSLLASAPVENFLIGWVSQI